MIADTPTLFACVAFKNCQIRKLPTSCLSRTKLSIDELVALNTRKATSLSCTVAISPFRWYETNRWKMRALKLHPNGELKWVHHAIESNGHAKVQAFEQYEEARKEATAFNSGIATRVAELDLPAEIQTSITLKAEKEITVLTRLADEEHLMLNEAVKSINRGVSLGAVGAS